MWFYQRVNGDHISIAPIEAWEVGHWGLAQQPRAVQDRNLNGDPRFDPKVFYWLVVDLPLWKIWKSVGIMTFPIWWEIHKSHVPVTTNQIISLQKANGSWNIMKSPPCFWQLSLVHMNWTCSKNMGSMWCWTWILDDFRQGSMPVFWARNPTWICLLIMADHRIKTTSKPMDDVDRSSKNSVAQLLVHSNGSHDLCGQRLNPLFCQESNMEIPHFFHEIPMAYDMHWYVMKVFFTSWISWFLRGKAILWAAELDNKTQRPATTRAGSYLPHVMRQKPLWCSSPQVSQVEFDDF